MTILKFDMAVSYPTCYKKKIKKKKNQIKIRVDHLEVFHLLKKTHYTQQPFPSSPLAIHITSPLIDIPISRS